jgi:hypothetical protein
LALPTRRPVQDKKTVFGKKKMKIFEEIFIRLCVI